MNKKEKEFVLKIYKEFVLKKHKKLGDDNFYKLKDLYSKEENTQEEDEMIQKIFRKNQIKKLNKQLKYLIKPQDGINYFELLNKVRDNILSSLKLDYDSETFELSSSSTKTHNPEVVWFINKN